MWIGVYMEYKVKINMKTRAAVLQEAQISVNMCGFAAE